MVVWLKTMQDAHPTHGAVPAVAFMTALQRTAEARGFCISGRLRKVAEAEALGDVSAARGADPPELAVFRRWPYFDPMTQRESRLRWRRQWASHLQGNEGG